MTSQELSQLRAYIKGAYPQASDSENDDLVWYDLLQGYEYAGLLESVKRYIRNGNGTRNEFPPLPSQIIKGYETILDGFNLDILDRMASDGVFDDPEFVTITDLNGIKRTIATEPEVRAWNRQKRIDRARNWLSKNFLPDWFKRDYQRYEDLFKQKYFGKTKVGMIE